MAGAPWAIGLLGYWAIGLVSNTVANPSSQLPGQRMSAASRWSRATRAIRYPRCLVIYGASETGAKFNHLERIREQIKQGAEVNTPIGFNRLLRQGEIPSLSSRRTAAWPGAGARSGAKGIGSSFFWPTEQGFMEES